MQGFSRKACWRGLAVAGTLALSALAFGRDALADSVFTVGNYPVEAQAQNAVAAKDLAIAEGQQAAFQSLLKRLVPVTAYKRLASLKTYKPADIIDGTAVRSERNSSTEYIATLDFSFEPGAVRDLLSREGIPFVDTQAPAAILVPVFQAPQGGGQAAGGAAGAQASRTWQDVWKGLDVEHSLTPLKIEALKASLAGDAVRSLRDGDPAGLRRLAAEYRAEHVLLALAEVDAGADRLVVTLSGQDAVGFFTLKRSYRLHGDFTYAAELAAIIALRTLEGRWKAMQVPAAASGPSYAAGGSGGFGGRAETVQLFIEFRSRQQWDDLRRQITETPGVVDFQIAGLSARSADVFLKFPGGGQQLAGALAGLGLQATNVGGTLEVRPRN